MGCFPPLLSLLHVARSNITMATYSSCEPIEKNPLNERIDVNEKEITGELRRNGVSGRANELETLTALRILERSEPRTAYPACQLNTDHKRKSMKILLENFPIKLPYYFINLPDFLSLSWPSSALLSSAVRSGVLHFKWQLSSFANSIKHLTMTNQRRISIRFSVFMRVQWNWQKQQRRICSYSYSECEWMIACRIYAVNQRELKCLKVLR